MRPCTRALPVRGYDRLHDTETCSTPSTPSTPNSSRPLESYPDKFLNAYNCPDAAHFHFERRVFALQHPFRPQIQFRLSWPALLSRASLVRVSLHFQKPALKCSYRVLPTCLLCFCMYLLLFC